MNYGVYQEAVFHFKDAQGNNFKQAWFLNAAEALTSAIVALLGFFFLKSNDVSILPHGLIAISGLTQVTAKASFSLGLVYKVSYAVATLAKSAKMAPVMAGNILRGVKYEMIQYLQVGAIIAGTMMVSWKPAKKDTASSMMGVAFICLSLVCDGITSNMQGQSKTLMKKANLSENPHESMFFTNLYMGLIAVAAAFYFGEIDTALAFCKANPKIVEKMSYFCVCSACGQIFIFFTIANFDSLVSTTITTTRKIFTVLLSIYNAAEPMSTLNWGGLLVAIVGILFEIIEKVGHKPKDKEAKKEK